MLNFLAKFIGKTAAISLVLAHSTTILKAQFLDTVASPHWPVEYSGDTQFFLRTNNQIISNYNLTDKGEYQLRINLPPLNLNHFYIRFNLELKINTSSSNTIQFGLLDSSSNTQYFQLGNTQDRWEAYSYQYSTPINIGENQEFAASSFKGTIQLKVFRDSIYLTTYHLSNQLISELTVPLFLKNAQFIFIKIQQSGKTAFQSHRISNISIDTPRKQKFSHIQNQQLNKNELRLSSNHSLNSSSGRVKIKNTHRKYTLNLDLKSFTIYLAESDSSNIEVQLDSFVTIWGEEIQSHKLQIKIKTITPIMTGDIVISEIMAVPEPAMNRFPKSEYIELYNNSNHFKNAHEISLIYNQKKLNIPDSIFPPNEATLLVPQSELNSWRIWSLNKYQTCNHIWGIPNFPNLINAEGVVLLKSTNGKLLDSLHYESKMHQPFALNGGFALETRNLNPLSNNFKWKTATNFSGSPGAISGVFNNEFPIEIEEYFLIDSDSIAFKLNIHPNLIPVIKVNSDSIYFLNTEENSTVIFKIDPQQPKTNSKLTFNEIYVKSATENDFIEIYNPHKFPLYLENYDILIYDENHFLKQIIPLKNSKRQVIMPQENMIFCRNTHSMKQQFEFAKNSSLVEIEYFPNLSQEGGFLTLVNHISGIVDECSFALLRPINRTTERNASFEKLHPQLLSNEPQNWYDCVSESGASPTLANSLTSNDNIFLKKWTSLVNKRLTTDPQGNYLLSVKLNIPDAGCLLSINLYNIWGEKISSICENISIPSQGLVQWPIITENKEPIRGNYIITFEILNQNKGSKLEYHRISIL